MLTPDTALKAAQAALKKCRDSGYQTAVAVVDRMGVLQVLIRDRFAGPHTPDMAKDKAYTAVSFRTNGALAVGSVAGKAFAYFLFFSTLALIVGLTVANVVRPGAGLGLGVAAPPAVSSRGKADKVKVNDRAQIVRARPNGGCLI